MNIYQKLAEVKKQVTYIKQDGKVEFGKTKYRFAGSEAVLSKINPLLNDIGLLLIPEILEQSVRVLNNTIFTELKMIYTWINLDDPTEKISIPWQAQGTDSTEKGIGKALTYSERYFLLKFFNIPTGEDDPEVHDQKNAIKAEKEAKVNLNPVKSEEKRKEQDNKKIESIKESTAKLSDEELMRLASLESSLKSLVSKVKNFESKFKFPIDIQGFANILKDHLDLNGWAKGEAYIKKVQSGIRAMNEKGTK